MGLRNRTFQIGEGVVLADGRYRVDRRLGVGGMAEVFLAHDFNLNVSVAIKFPDQILLRKKEFLDRFLQETHSLVELRHPNILNIIDVGEHEGTPFAVMEYLSGGTINDQRFRDANDNFIPVLPVFFSGWLNRIADAFDFIHRKGYVHRDVKPDNILFDEDGNAFLSDFGIAKVYDQTNEAHANFTRTGMLVGTPEYVAPEINLGKPYDGRSDQYSLAVLVYELLVGSRPFVGNTPAALVISQTQGQFERLYELKSWHGSGVSKVLKRALCIDPVNRFSSCGEFESDLANEFAKIKDRRIKGTVVSKCPNCAASVLINSDWSRRNARCDKCSGRLQNQAAGMMDSSSATSDTPAETPLQDTTRTRVATDRLIGSVEGVDERAAAEELLGHDDVGNLSNARSKVSAITMASIAALFAMLLLFAAVIVQSRLRTPELSKDFVEKSVSSDTENANVAKPRVNDSQLERPQKSRETQLDEFRSIKDFQAQQVNESETFRYRLPIPGSMLPEISLELADDSPNGVDYDDTTRTVTWTPSEQQGPADVTIQFSVRSRETNDVVKLVSLPITVDELNQAPVISPIPTLEIMAGFEVNHRFKIDDGDLPANRIQITLENNKTDAMVSADGLFQWKVPQDREPGPCTFNLQISDGTETIKEAFNVKVEKLVAPPTFVNPIGMRFVGIRSGVFQMGTKLASDTNESIELLRERAKIVLKRAFAEHPAHQVSISKPFYMSATEVTQKQWREVMGTSPWKESHFPDFDHFPANCISHEIAREFCNRLSQNQGIAYRLPTEAEWEYACRAGTNTDFSFGSMTPPTGVSRVVSSEWRKQLRGKMRIRCKVPSQVGQYSPNLFGLYDMHGNVAEWCSDVFDIRYYQQSPKQDPTGPKTGSRFVFRGGAYDDFERYCRSSSRSSGSRGYGSIGFRPVLELSADLTKIWVIHSPESSLPLPPPKLPVNDEQIYDSMELARSKASRIKRGVGRRRRGEKMDDDMGLEMKMALLEMEPDAAVPRKSSKEDLPKKLIEKSPLDAIINKSSVFLGLKRQTAPPPSTHNVRLTIVKKLGDSDYQGTLHYLQQNKADGSSPEDFTYEIRVYSPKKNENITLHCTRILSNPQNVNLYSNSFSMSAKVTEVGFVGSDIQLKPQ